MEFDRNSTQIISDSDSGQPGIISDPIPKFSDHFENARNKMVFGLEMVRICFDHFHPYLLA
jgi:hypothetical protein